MDAPPKDVATARLSGGVADGIVVEIVPGTETFSFGPMLTLFGALDRLSDDERKRLEDGRYEYRYVALEDVPEREATHKETRRAVFSRSELTDAPPF